MTPNNRDAWEFPYRACEVVAACRKRVDHHDARTDFWRGQRSDAERDLRLMGIEMREHQVTGGTRMQAMLDPDRAARLEECQAKVRDHQRQAERYGVFLAGLERLQPDAFVPLMADDITFFGIADPAAEER